MSNVDSLLNNIQDMCHSDRIKLLNAINDIGDLEKVTDIIESKQDNETHCPYCNKTKIHKHGKSANLQRYKCLGCGKTFNALTGTSLSRLRKKELWLKHMDCMRESLALRKVAKKLGISLKTAFLWRHRFVKEFKNDSPETLFGIVEADETYFQISHKGSRKLKRKPHKRGSTSKKRGVSKDQVCVLTAMDRSKNDIATITGLGSVKGKSLIRHLENKIASDAVMVTDGLRSYNYFCNKNNIAHEIITSNKRVCWCYHIQNINSYHSRLKLWIAGAFHGVATKYLNHYLWWRHELESSNITNSAALLRIALGIPQLK